MPLTVRFAGSGDAFGSGGRFQACIVLEAGDDRMLLDCGASSLIALRRLGVEPATIDAVLLSHLHGDHFGGIPFLVLDGQFARRTRPLLVAGPAGTRARLTQAMDVLFPGSSTARRAFTLDVVELEAERSQAVGRARVTAYAVDHPSGAPALALRVAWEGVTVAYTGDTAWTDSLVAASREADLLIAEAYYHDKPVPFHLSYRTLTERRPELSARRLVVTHMSEDMLSRLGTLDCECAEDGKVIELP
jgi:ribonuclease BN (tRNA processing enzyme)